MSNKSIPKFVYPLIIIFITILIYSNSIKNGFVNWDDDISVTTNTDVFSLDVQKVFNMFNNSYNGMYQPAVMLTFALNYAIHGLQPAGYHLTNLLFHLLNILLLFVFIRLLFKNIWLATITALVFAVHPMHVESVSWITERKDVLYAFFYLASMIMYVRYIQSTYKKKFLILAFIFFLLSLLSKTNAITFPFILIAIDLYLERSQSKRSLIEKSVFFLFAILFGLIAMKSQEVLAAGSFRNVHYNILDRIIIACHAFDFYILRFVFPFHLSALYPFPLKPNGFLPFQYYLSVVLTIALLFGTLKLVMSKTINMESRKLIKFAAQFFLFTISIVVFIPVGKADVADRYTYIPYIGLTLILYPLIKLVFQERFKKWIIISGAGILILFSFLTFQRNKVWKDSLTLWTDVIKKYPTAELAYYGRGNYFQSVQNFHGALFDFNKAIELKPDFSLAYNNRGAIKLYLKDFNGALVDLNKSILLDPKDKWAYYNRALVFLNLNLNQTACIDLQKSIELGNIAALDVLNKFCNESAEHK
jgi:protein O-mannosyl-transferase